MSQTKELIDYLFSPTAIREKAQAIFNRTIDGKTNFSYHKEKLDDVVDLVIDVIKDNYPDYNIPFHSRLGHFKVGGVDRTLKINDLISDKLERARVKLDLVITSVLLDAGAGPTWKYNEKETDKTFNRSEGLGVASFHMFMKGAFSTDGSLKAECGKLKKISAKDIEEHFQVTNENPLVGSKGRSTLLRNLGECVGRHKDAFKDGRPGNIIDHMINKYGQEFLAKDLLKEVLNIFGEIWPSRIQKDGVNLGDIWEYAPLGGGDKALVPFHKLSQWLTYSLIEVIEEAGVTISNAFEMTGLAEYRNGGLLIDSGLLTLKDESLYGKAFLPNDHVIIEWRALTIHLLDIIGEKVREKLNFSKDEFPLAKVLEGGTWWAGRRLAQEKREDQSPPIKLDSDGTVF